MTDCIIHYDGTKPGDLHSVLATGANAIQKACELHEKKTSSSDEPDLHLNVCKQLRKYEEGYPWNGRSYHKACYRKFTKIIEKQKPTESSKPSGRGRKQTRTTKNMTTNRPDAKRPRLATTPMRSPSPAGSSRSASSIPAPPLSLLTTFGAGNDLYGPECVLCSQVEIRVGGRLE